MSACSVPTETVTSVALGASKRNVTRLSGRTSTSFIEGSPPLLIHGAGGVVLSGNCALTGCAVPITMTASAATVQRKVRFIDGPFVSHPSGNARFRLQYCQLF